MLKKIFHLLTIATLGLYATDSSAQIFKFSRSVNCGTAGQVVCDAFTDLLDTELAKAESDLNDQIPGGKVNRFMDGLADSSVMAGKGIGSDYSSYMDVFLIGVGVGAGADLEKSKDPKSDISGLGAAAGAVFGLNLGVLPANKILGLETNRLSLYFNFLPPLKANQNLGEAEVNLKTMSFGSHIRYDWVKPKGNKLFGWGGLKIHTGYEYNYTKIGLQTTINETIDGEDVGAGVSIDPTLITGSPSGEVEVATHSIPLEISTDIRFLYFLSLYTGLGIDYSFGKAKGLANGNVDDINVSCSGVSCGGASANVEPEANLNGSGKVTSFMSRGFLGVQFNIPLLRVFVQADKGLGNDLIGATAGVRLTY